MEITGILMRKVGEREGYSSRNGNPWKTAEFLVEIPGQYPRHIKFDVRDGQSGRIAHFESLVGKTVTVSFDIDAHEYQNRWFNELNAWGVMEYVPGRQIPQTKVAPAPQENGTAPAEPKPSTGDENKEGGDDGLPF